MPAIKIYKCCICHETLDYKPIRLTKQKYGAGPYKQYYPIENYDFCKRCYFKFQRWLDKHSENGSEKNGMEKRRQVV